MTQHTQGPWFIQHWDNFPDQTVISDETNTRCLAVIDKVDEQDEANARLIAAAPELLEALEKCLETMQWALSEGGNMTKYACQDLQDIIKDAIAKATGGKA